MVAHNGAGTGVVSVFDLNGRLLTAPQKGLNIIGGRKVIVK